MNFLHSMIRVADLDAAMHFWGQLLGLIEISRYESEAGRFTLVYLAAPGDKKQAEESKAPLLELTYNWPTAAGESETYAGGRNFGHVAFRVDDIYGYCERLMDNGVVINRPPRDGYMAFVRSPDGISVELLQAGQPLEKAEPWISMPNIGEW